MKRPFAFIFLAASLLCSMPARATGEPREMPPCAVATAAVPPEGNGGGDARTLSAEGNAASFVDPFIGTAATGHTFPGACRPFGLVQPSPVTGSTGWTYCAEYLHADSVVYGFSQTHLNGTGCMDLGDILLMPANGRGMDAPFASQLDKKSETAAPGYYAARLATTGVLAEVTAAAHTALYRFTYNNTRARKTDGGGGEVCLLVDLQHGPAWSEKQQRNHVRACSWEQCGERTLRGHVKSSVWVEQDVFFYLTFNRPVARIDTLPLRDKGERAPRLLLTFDDAPGARGAEGAEVLNVAVALSGVSEAGAQANFMADTGGDAACFDSVRTAAYAEWNALLGRFKAQGTKAQLTAFYTALYHLCVQPNNIADADGRFRNAADEVKRRAGGGRVFSTFSTWDTYRAAHPLYTLFTPERVPDFVASMVEQSDATGHLPVWALWGKENYCMIGNHGVSIVAEAAAKGLCPDEGRAYEAVKRSLTVNHGAKSRFDLIERYGFLPADLQTSESVSITLEGAYDDYAAARMAERLGLKADARRFAKRAEAYKNLFDAESGFFRPRLADGRWLAPFNPAALAHAESCGGHFTEGNAWQYLWHVQHDVEGLTKLLGGKKALAARLDSFFTLRLESSLSDVTGLIGQYAHGNEPSHHVAFLYILAGERRKAERLVGYVFDSFYRPEPDGLCGNDDCGQMSAWYVFAALGLYPLDPVSAEYLVAAPQLPRLELQLPGGRTLRMEAKGVERGLKHVKGVRWNGRKLRGNFITHAELAAGGLLEFEMGE